ncbi:MAG: UDP-3-O-(3-hydroxymyristoyl)glucosamine N-acyltransferase, partial [Cyanobacteriota bacterium]
FIYTTRASVTIVNSTFVPESELTTTLIKVEDAYGAFTKILEFYNLVKHNKTGIEQFAVVSDTAKTGENFYLGSFSYIGNNVTIGDNVKIYPNSYIGDNVSIGSNVLTP